VIHVIDLTITSDHVNPRIAWDQKCDYYNTSEITQWTRTQYPIAKDVKYGAIVLNWRGALLKESSQVLIEIGIKQYDQIILAVRMLFFTANLHKFFHKSTTHHDTKTTVPI